LRGADDVIPSVIHETGLLISVEWQAA